MAVTTTDDARLRAAIGDLDEQFATLAVGARARLRQYAAAAHPEMTVLSFAVVKALARGSRNQGDLAAELGVDKTAVSRAVSQLEVLGLATRASADADRRANVLSLTEAGHEAEGRASVVRLDELDRRLVGWEPADVEQLADLLGRFNAR
jgi:DNA-binding MarR family transcriptional regulator